MTMIIMTCLPLLYSTNRAQTDEKNKKAVINCLDMKGICEVTRWRPRYIFLYKTENIKERQYVGFKKSSLFSAQLP